ncbi:flavin mononucleotide hydrolase 1, chloroplatic [Cornus florida]|uniref:flavin mononucleotide hydrolase 1, chloroplatic n=1 Tax=Cornus florida TaxID=4283 RepID=UPI00289CC6B4|nr:flavin mononucleotide hydrolase 1, chloroplatic [Cornus florida]
MALLLRPTAFSLHFKPSKKSAKMALNFTKTNNQNTNKTSSIVASSTGNDNNNPTRRLPILLFDVMDTLVRDPFYQDIPAFFRMSLKELIECKHPTAWIEFEKGLIDEMELASKFFKDGRPFDLAGLKKCMINGYSYLEGVEGLLHDLKQSNYEMHTFTNYPIWYKMIEDKLKLSTYLSWTFCSCISGKRKPEPDFYLEVLRHLDIDPASCIFIDDRMQNVEAAIDAGIIGLQFKNADLLRQDLSRLGIDMSLYEGNRNQDPAEIAQ